MYCLTDTIYALSSGSGKAGISVIRISGKQSISILKSITNLSIIKPRYAYFTPLVFNKKILDNAVVLYFKSPHSFTGEDIIELHIHGSSYILKSIFDCLSSFENCRLAEPGEFSRRAVLNGKMDLTQAEGIMDLINAQTSAQHEQSLTQVNGELKKIYDLWRHDLIKINAYLEAFIDFPEEEIPQEKQQEINQKIKSLIQKISIYLEDNHIGQRLKEGFKIVLLGSPNTGKSSFMNYITQQDTAIVSEKAGTTRDIIETHLDVFGLPIILSDTAGLRKTKGDIETQGIDKALSRAEKADLILYLQDATCPHKKRIPLKEDLLKKTLFIWNKIDLNSSFKTTDFTISAKTGKGIDILWDHISERIKNEFGGHTHGFITQERYRIALKETVSYLKASLLEKELELKTEMIRLASRALGRITGSIETNDLLDVIFKEFCIGK